MKRTIIAGALVAALLPAAAHAQPFDVETATRAYLDLLQGPARARSDAYFEGGYWLILWDALASVLACTLLLATGWSARMRDWAERVTRRRWLVPIVYAVPFVIAYTALLLPWTAYVEYVREHQYGLSNQGVGEWLGDWAKSLGVSLVIYAAMFGAIFTVIRGFPRTWWLWGAGIATAFLAFGALLQPVFVAPLFNSYTELPAGPLRTRIVAMAEASHIPAEHIWVADESKQSKRISANVAGIGPTVRISLNDNLLAHTTPDETVAVMGHEMWHYVLNHIPKMIALFGVALLVLFFAVARAAPLLIRRFPRWRVRGVDDPAAAPVLLGLAAVAGMVLEPVQAGIVRHNEIAADAFGLDIARQPDAFALVAMRLSKYRKIEPGPVEEALFFDHPSGATRVRMAMQWKKDHVPGATIVHPTVKLD